MPFQDWNYEIGGSCKLFKKVFFGGFLSFVWDFCVALTCAIINDRKTNMGLCVSKKKETMLDWKLLLSLRANIYYLPIFTWKAMGEMIPLIQLHSFSQLCQYTIMHTHNIGHPKCTEL